MENKNLFKSECAFLVAVAGLTVLAVSCQSSTPPSNLSLSESDAQAVQNDRIQKTNQAHQAVIDIRNALSPVEGILRDLSNVSAKVDAKVGGKSIDNLHLSDGFQLIDKMLDQTSQSGLVTTDKSGGWIVTQSVDLSSSVQIGNCNSVQAELSGRQTGDRGQIKLNLIECGGTSKILVAEAQINKDVITADLHLENLKDLSISVASSGSACSLSLDTSGNQVRSHVDCAPLTIQLGSNEIEISPLSIAQDANSTSGKISVHGFDVNGNEFLSVNYPKADTAAN